MMLRLITAYLIFACFSDSTAQAKVIELHRGVSANVALDVTTRKADISEKFANISAAGFDFVRIVVDPSDYVNAHSDETTETLNAGVKQVVKLAQSAKLKVLVDFHAVPTSVTRRTGTESYLASSASFAEYTALAKGLAAAFSDEDSADIAFEPMNEPTLDCESPESLKKRWPELAKQLHDAVRSAAPKITIVMEGGCWGGADGLAQLNPAEFNDDNIIWSFHSYEPMIFTHQGATWSNGPQKFVNGLSFPAPSSLYRSSLKAALRNIAMASLKPSERNLLAEQSKTLFADYFNARINSQQIEAPFETVATWAKAHSIPPERVLLGEFGVISLDAPRGRESGAAYLKLMRQMAEKHGWAWAVWDWDESFAITDEVHRIILPAYADALGLR